MNKPKPEQPSGNRTRTYIAAGLVLLAAVLLVVWLVSGDDGDSSDGDSGAATSSGAPAIVSSEALEEAAEDGEAPIYWAGERQGTELELSRPDPDRAYVRYLADGAKAGDPRPDFLTVGTYAAADPVAELRRQGKEPNGVLGTAPGGATVYFDRSEPLSVYVAFPGEDVQVEVFDPNFNQALRLVDSGQIVPAD